MNISLSLHEHHLSYLFRRRPQLEVQAQEIMSCYESSNIISVLTGCRQISFYSIRQSDIFITTIKNILSPRAKDTYPNMYKVQKLKEEHSVDKASWAMELSLMRNKSGLALSTFKT